jgi:hypothetical protein
MVGRSKRKVVFYQDENCSIQQHADNWTTDRRMDLIDQGRLERTIRAMELDKAARELNKTQTTKRRREDNVLSSAESALRWNERNQRNADDVHAVQSAAAARKQLEKDEQDRRRRMVPIEQHADLVRRVDALGDAVGRTLAEYRDLEVNVRPIDGFTKTFSAALADAYYETVKQTIDESEQIAPVVEEPQRPETPEPLIGITPARAESPPPRRSLRLRNE